MSWIHEFDEWINKYLNLTYHENQTVLKVYLKIMIFNLIRFFVHHQLFSRSARCRSLFIKIAMFQLIRQYTKAIHRHTHRNKIKSLCLNFKGRKDKKGFKNEIIMGLKIRKSCKNLEFRSGPFQLKIWSHHIWNIEISKHWKFYQKKKENENQNNTTNSYLVSPVNNSLYIGSIKSGMFAEKELFL